MKYIIYDLMSKQWFIGSNLDGSYFSGEDNPKYFYSKSEAYATLGAETKYKPEDFNNRIITVLEIILPNL